ncbi:MAG: sigma-70 family RNA polymerase sigma factor [Planctomycetota bacterium]|nr:sigma-70 family RNA polymerase sigma factor [Planctomycetota bacterium]
MNLDTIIERWRGALVGLLAAWGASPRDAVELAQDTFAEAYLARERFAGAWEDEAAVGAWLRGIASNLHLAHGRRRRPGGRRSLPLEAAGDPAEVERAAPPGASALVEAVGRLRGPWRTVLMMRYVEGSGLAEIAGLLGIGERAVEGRLRRARASLKELIETEGLAEGTKDEHRTQEGQA